VRPGTAGDQGGRVNATAPGARGLSRREFVGCTAGIAAAATFPSLQRTGAAVTPLTGATVNPGAYNVSTYLDAASIYNSYVGLPLATTFEKVYMNHGQFGTAPPLKMTQLAAADCQFLVSVEPSRTMTRTEQKLMASWIAMLKTSGMSFRVVLYSECNDKAFKTVGEWLPYWRYYAPVIKGAGVACCYEPGCGGTAVSRAEAFFPSSPAPDELWMDYYATAFRGGSRLDKLIAIAGAAGISAGLGEFGWSAGDAPTTNPMTMPWWDKYCVYLSQLAIGGKLKLGAINFSAKANNKTVDVIKSPTDPRIPGIHEVVGAVRLG
jgi:hypothetical protein